MTTDTTGASSAGHRLVVLVEGVSDVVALQALARRRGRSLDGVTIVAMGGATNAGRYLQRYGPHGLDVPLAGLCDATADRYFCRALTRAGIPARSRTEMRDRGFHVCEADLEDELIKALGTGAVEEIIESQGELRSLRSLRRQPAQRSRSTHEQLRRFLGSKAGRKRRYAGLLVDALDLSRVPPALDGALERV